MDRKNQVALLIFVSFIVVLLSLVLWPYICTTLDPVYIVSSLIIVPLIYFGTQYLTTHGTPKAERVVVAICLGFVVSLIVWAIDVNVYRLFVGDVPQGDLGWVFFFGSYIVGFMIAAYLSGRLQYPSEAESEN
jgi:Na+/melibiose symporter-like transporter